MNEKEIGKRLKEVREVQGLPQSELAELLGKARTSFSKYETGMSQLDYASLIILRETYGVDLNWFLTGTNSGLAHYNDPKGINIIGTNEFILVPLIPHKVTSAPVKEFLCTQSESLPTKKGLIKRIVEDGLRDGKFSSRGKDEEELLKYLNDLPRVSGPKKFANNNTILALEAQGDSMNGVNIFDGDLVFFAPGENRGDGLYALLVNDEIIVKRLEFDQFTNTINICSENPRYPSRSEPLNSQLFTILGKLRGWIHYYS